jgi:hypothetical protein
MSGKTLVNLVLATVAMAVVAGCRHHPVARPELRAAGLELLLRTEAAFFRDDKACADAIVDGVPSQQPAQDAAAAMHLSSLAAAARVDPFWRRRLEEYAGVVGGDDGLAPDLVLAMLDAYELTGDPALLTGARGALRQTSGRSDPAAIVVALLRIYRLTGAGEYLARAERTPPFADPHTPGSAAGVIAARCAWFDVTDDVKHLRFARRAADQALDRFVVRWPPHRRGAIRGDTASAAQLADALLELYRRDGDARWHAAAVDAARFASRNADPAGWHPSTWDVAPRRALKTVRLIDQSAAARAMIRADTVR